MDNLWSNILYSDISNNKDADFNKTVFGSNLFEDHATMGFSAGL
jgi:hypothetical protein